jgi:hypothetical protein
MGQFDLRRLRACRISLVPLVKTRDFGMTPEAQSLKILKLSHYTWVSLQTETPDHLLF